MADAAMAVECGDENHQDRRGGRLFRRSHRARGRARGAGAPRLSRLCLAERTIALAQQARQTDPGAGFDALLAERFNAVLRPCVANKVAIITNMGAANPIGAARAAAGIARGLGISGLKIAAVSGDDVTQAMRGRDLPLIETRGRVADIADRIVSANAYLGAEPIVAAL